jgi:hypothetical protein
MVTVFVVTVLHIALERVVAIVAVAIELRGGRGRRGGGRAKMDVVEALLEGRAGEAVAGVEAVAGQNHVLMTLALFAVLVQMSRRVGRRKNRRRGWGT